MDRHACQAIAVAKVVPNLSCPDPVSGTAMIISDIAFEVETIRSDLDIEASVALSWKPHYRFAFARNGFPMIYLTSGAAYWPKAAPVASISLPRWLYR